MKRVLVTGGCGFIGCNLVRHLLDSTDCHVLNIDALTYAGSRASLKDKEHDDRYQFLHADVTTSTVIQIAMDDFKPDVVMHLAAESHVDRSIDEPDAFIQTNVVGTYTVLDAARHYFEQLPDDRKRQFRFIHVSTDEVYGSLGSHGSFKESTPYAPRSPYSASKAASDHLARAWFHTYRLPVIVTNCSNNYGPFQFPEKLIPVVILNAIAGSRIPVYGNGENIRDWLFVADHCEALVEVACQGQPGETYNIGGNNEMSNIRLVQTLCKLLDELKPLPSGRSYASQIAFVEDRPGHDRRYAIDASKIRSELGWKPSSTGEEAFRKTIAWYLQNDPWWREILDGSYRLERRGLSPAATGNVAQ